MKYNTTPQSTQDSFPAVLLAPMGHQITDAPVSLPSSSPSSQFFTAGRNQREGDDREQAGGGSACLLSHIGPKHTRKPHNFRILETTCKDDTLLIHEYRKDIVIKKLKPTLQNGQGNEVPKRGEIFEFTKKSKARLSRYCRNSGHHVKSQFCLTYHENIPKDGRVIKKHLKDFFKHLSRYHPALYYLWIVEFQKRAAPHLHVFLNLEINEKNHLALVAAWKKAIGPEYWTEKMEKVHGHKTNFIEWKMDTGSYLIKYVEKVSQKDVPEEFYNIGRFWGASRNMKPDFATIHPDDHDEEVKDNYIRAIRMITKYYERKIDSYKAKAKFIEREMEQYNKEVMKNLGRPLIPEEFPSFLRAARLRVHAVEPWKTTRLTPKTNLRKSQRSYTLPGCAELFNHILNYLMSPETAGVLPF